MDGHKGEAGDQQTDRRSVRLPVAAGYFYSADRQQLLGQLDWCFTHPLGPGAIADREEAAAEPICLVSPHAGVQYSGPIAAHAYYGIGEPTSVVVIGPNHYDRGHPVAVSPEEAWLTPLGSASCDAELRRALLEAYTPMQPDSAAHSLEHSIELQLIFLQYVLGTEFQLVAIAIRDHRPSTAIDLGHSLAVVLRERPALLIASTDLSHYEPDAVARQEDLSIVELIERLDEKELASRIITNRAALCGPGPLLATMVAARDLGAKRANLLKYGNSGETGGDVSSVVGYAALRMERD